MLTAGWAILQYSGVLHRLLQGQLSRTHSSCVFHSSCSLLLLLQICLWSIEGWSRTSAVCEHTLQTWWVHSLQCVPDLLHDSSQHQMFSRKVYKLLTKTDVQKSQEKIKYNSYLHITLIHRFYFAFVCALGPCVWGWIGFKPACFSLSTLIELIRVLLWYLLMSQLSSCGGDICLLLFYKHSHSWRQKPSKAPFWLCHLSGEAESNEHN